jgi:DNA-binding cell septation regulator SpoVG
MHISIENFDKSFNVSLHSTPEKEPFLVIKGCRIANGKNGEFVSWPATKSNDKWWNHVYASEAFAATVLEKYKTAQPKKSKAADDDSIPF